MGHKFEFGQYFSGIVLFKIYGSFLYKSMASRLHNYHTLKASCRIIFSKGQFGYCV